MKQLTLALLLTSTMASAASWKHHECTVTFDQQNFRVDVYSSWNRCEGTLSGKRYPAVVKTALDNYAPVTGEESQKFQHDFYAFKNISKKYPGIFSFMVPHEEDHPYQGFGEYIPTGSSNIISFQLSCNLASDLGCDE